ncbi:MAG: hypothetical protein JWM91_4978 [Rhodospirillales bacterium]|nr:hypothetical protein [Rhodospirillales bacterium]
MPLPRVIHGIATKRAQLVAELAHNEKRAEYSPGLATIDDALAL